jgi:general secretion pathway protein I
VSVSKPHRKLGVIRCGPAQPAGCGSAGFTLLEALIAIVILALSLSALLSLYSTGLRGINAIDDQLRARLLAQSVMAELSYDRALRPGTLEGRFERFAWTLSVTPFDTGDTEPRQPGPWTVYQLALTVSWPYGRRFELQTLRMLRTK